MPPKVTARQALNFAKALAAASPTAARPSARSFEDEIRELV
jgi:hypothetical protein